MVGGGLRNARRRWCRQVRILFIALPALLAVVGARLLDRRVGDAVLGTVAAGALGALTWFLTILWLASQGVFE
jgi:hypothetical protein